MMKKCVRGDGTKSIAVRLVFLLGTVPGLIDATQKAEISFSSERTQIQEAVYERAPLSELRSSAFSNSDIDVILGKQQRVCDIGDGTIYQEGETVTSFELRCGATEYFPCTCAPDLNPPLACPYCGYYSTNDNNNGERKRISQSQNFFCLKDGETSDPFVGKEGIYQECSCSVQGLKPISSCRPMDQNEKESSPSKKVGFEGSEEKMVLGDPSSSIQEENYAVVKRDENTTTNDENGPVTATINSTTRQEDAVSKKNFDAEHRDPNRVSEATTLSLPSHPKNIRRDRKNRDTCILKLDDFGTIRTFRRGESYGSYLPNRCIQSCKYPCFCNPDLYNQIECPYCGFEIGDGKLLCSTDKETVSFFDPESKTGDIKTCSCSLSDIPGEAPETECSVTNPLEDYKTGKVSPSQSIINNVEGCEIINPLDGELVIIPDGESFSDYVPIEGPCGDGNEWPAFCSYDGSSPVTDVLSQTKPPRVLHNNIMGVIADIKDRKDVLYPYCIFMSGISKKSICAKYNEEVVYTNEGGEKIICSCYFSSITGGAYSTCSTYMEELPRDDAISASNRITSDHPSHTPVLSQTTSTPVKSQVSMVPTIPPASSTPIIPQVPSAKSLEQLPIVPSASSTPMITQMSPSPTIQQNPNVPSAPSMPIITQMSSAPTIQQNPNVPSASSMPMITQISSTPTIQQNPNMPSTSSISMMQPRSTEPTIQSPSIADSLRQASSLTSLSKLPPNVRSNAKCKTAGSRALTCCSMLLGVILFIMIL